MYQTPVTEESVDRVQGEKAWAELRELATSAWPLANFSDVTVLVGVSGGADSVGLLRTLLAIRPQDARGKLVVAHYNHRLRGDDSDDDARFVRSIAEEFDLSFELGLALHDASHTLSKTANLNRSSTDEVLPAEESLRNQRYAFFQETANRIGARYVALAHTQDDRIETVLHHLLRGTGPAGLTGIPAFRGLGQDLVVARPLLQAPGSLIRTALAFLGQSYRHDRSNDASLWSRNWIRNELLPMIAERYPDARNSIVRASRLAENQQSDLRLMANDWISEHTSVRSERLEFRCDKGQQAGIRLTQSVFHAAAVLLWDRMGWPRGAMANRHWEQLWRLVWSSEPRGGMRQPPTETLNLPGNLRAQRIDGRMVVVERNGGD